MIDYSFVCGQVRALESSLLSQNQIDRMVGAANLKDAFDVLVELQYAKYLTPNTSEKDFLNIIETGLVETKKLLVSGTENDPVLGLLWSPIDINNIKRAIKEKKNGAESIVDFSENAGYSLLGSLTESELNGLVFLGQSTESVSAIFQKYLIPLLADIDNLSLLEIENSLDIILYKELKEISEIGLYPDSILDKIIRQRIDAVNIKNLSRNILLREVETRTDQFISGGNYSRYVFVKCNTKDSAVAFIEKYLLIKSDVATHAALLGFIRDIDLLLEKKHIDTLYNAQLGQTSSVLIPLYYFEKRMQNARFIKFIMFAKEQGMSSDKIYEALERL